MDAIERYLDDLAARLHVGPSRARRVLAEAEDHLREAAAREVAEGADGKQAQHRAIERFGTPRQVSAAVNGPVRTHLASLAVGGAQLAAVASVAVLVGTLLARVTAALTSTTSAFGLPPGYLPSHGRAAHWLAAQPTAHDWTTAAALENADDTLVLRSGFAIVCLIASIAVLRFARRRINPPDDGVVPAIGMTAFGGAGVLLLAGALTNSYTSFEWGRGLWFCDAAVSLIAAAAYAVTLMRRMAAT